MSWKRLYKILNKPITVVIFRLWQELVLFVYYKCNQWQKIEEKILLYWDEKKVESFISNYQNILIAPNISKSLHRVAAQLNMETDWEQWGKSVYDKKFSLLNSAVAIDNNGFSWFTDPRYNKTWETKYFKHYRHYQKRKIPYDIKYPWELSRLGFLQTLLQLEIIDKTKKYSDEVYDTIIDWQKKNPLCYSINWYPMEASIRAINLVIVLEMLCDMKIADQRVVHILQLLTSHGEFIYKNIEYTDVRGNHYTANIVSLLLLGITLKNFYRPAKKWYQYAYSKLSLEINLQILPDGVNFEKSTSYHKLVAELFLIAYLALEKKQLSVCKIFKERLYRAFRYSAFYTRPDGKAPIIGDSDDARIFNFDFLDANDHRYLLPVAAYLFDDSFLYQQSGSISSTSLWLVGEPVVHHWKKHVNTEMQKDYLQYFSAAGIVIAKNNYNFLWMDIGEVGMFGRGGHGHNDLLSFEVSLNKTPIIIDPGSYVYTADPELRDLFRSTHYHNVLQVDNQEIANLKGMWQIENNAVPIVEEVRLEKQKTLIRAAHTGYLSLKDPVQHTREIFFDLEQGILRCCDFLKCKEKHQVKRFLHFSSDLEIVFNGGGITISKSNKKICYLKWSFTNSELIDGWVSSGYGKKTLSKILVLKNEIDTNTQLSFEILCTKHLSNE